MRPTLDTVVRAVLADTGCTLAEIAGRRRSRDIVASRRAIAYLARELTRASFPEIAEFTTNRSWSTWVGAAADARALLDQRSERHDPTFRAMVARISLSIAKEP